MSSDLSRVLNQLRSRAPASWGREQPITSQLKKICSWCQSVQDAGSAADAEVTHTICLKCMIKVQAEMDEYERKRRNKKDQEK